MITPLLLIRSTEPGYSGRLDLALFPGYSLAALVDEVTTVITLAYDDPRVGADDAKAVAFVYREMYDRALVTAITRPGEIRLDNLGTRKANTALLVSSLKTWIAQYAAIIDAPAVVETYDPYASHTVQITNRPA